MSTRSQALPAGTPVWINNTSGRLKAGTAAVTVTACERDGYAENVTVRTEDGREHTIGSFTVVAMLPEEIEPWQA